MVDGNVVLFGNRSECSLVNTPPAEALVEDSWICGQSIRDINDMCSWDDKLADKVPSVAVGRNDQPAIPEIVMSIESSHECVHPVLVNIAPLCRIESHGAERALAWRHLLHFTEPFEVLRESLTVVCESPVKKREVSVRVA